MKYIPLSVLEEINEYKFDLKELDKAISETTDTKNRQYLEGVRTEIVEKLNQLENMKIA